MSLKDAAEYITQFGHGLFKDEQAAEIVDFVKGIKDRDKGILVHCGAGVSRSAAVAAAIELILNGSNEKVFNDRRYSVSQTIMVPVVLESRR